MRLLLAAALIPPLALVFYTYKLDKIEKEPTNLLVKLFLLGALTCIPAGLIEAFLLRIVGQGLAPESVGYQLITNFFCIALVEEGWKYLVLKKCTWNHPAFDYQFDAIVYAVTTSLGFAALENILYVFQGGVSGLEVAGLRALTAIPGHCIFAIFMGSYYGLMKYHDINGNPSAASSRRIMALVVPMLIHGFYDFSASSGGYMVAIFYIFIIVMDILAFRRIRMLSKQDRRLLEEGFNTQDYYQE